jgi:hypothetical protein
MQTPRREPWAAFDLVTANDLSPETVWPVIEEAYRVLVAPALDRLEELFPMNRGKMALETTSGRLTSWPCSDSAWSQATAMVSADGVNSFTVTGVPERDLDGMRVPTYEVGVWLDLQRGTAFFDEEGLPNTLHANISPALIRDFAGSGQDTLVSFAKRAAKSLHAITGYLTVDFASRESPYERALLERHFHDAVREAREKVRGYYWGNFLSSGHVEALGGLERLEQEGLGSIEVLVPPDELVYLQLSDRITDTPPEQLRALKTLFGPVLAEGQEIPHGWIDDHPIRLAGDL